MLRTFLALIITVSATGCAIYEPIDLVNAPDIGFPVDESPKRNFYRDTIYIRANSVTATGGKFVLAKRADSICALMFDKFKRVKNRQPDKSGYIGDPIEVSDYTAVHFKLNTNKKYVQTETVKGIISIGSSHGSGFHTSTRPYNNSYVNCGNQIPLNAIFGGNFHINHSYEKKYPYSEFYFAPTNFSEISADRINNNLESFKWYQTLDGYAKTIEIKLSDLKYE